MNIVVKTNSWQHRLAQFLGLHTEHCRVGTDCTSNVRIMTEGALAKHHAEYVASVERARVLRRQHGIN